MHPRAAGFRADRNAPRSAASPSCDYKACKASCKVRPVAEEAAAEIDSAEQPIRQELRRLSAWVERLTASSLTVEKAWSLPRPASLQQSRPGVLETHRHVL